MNTKCTLCKIEIVRQSIRPLMVCFNCKKLRIKKNYQRIIKK